LTPPPLTKTVPEVVLALICIRNCNSFSSGIAGMRFTLHADLSTAPELFTNGATADSIDVIPLHNFFVGSKAVGKYDIQR